MKRLFVFSAVACLAVILVSPAMARDKIVDLLIQKQIVSEEEVAALEDGTMGTTSIQSASSDISIGGYGQPYWMWTDSETDDDYNTFNVRRMYIYLRGEAAPGWGYFLSYDFVPGMVIDANVSYTYSPMFTVTAGQFLLPYSNEQLTSSSSILTIQRSMATAALSDGRDIGIEVTGQGWDNRFGYGVAVVNGTGMNTGDENDKKDIIARVALRPWCTTEGSPLCGFVVAGGLQTGEQVLWGVDAEGLDVGVGEDTRTRYIGTAAWTYPLDNGSEVRVVGEYLYEEWDDMDSESDGWYIIGAYAFPMNGTLIEPVAKYETYDPSDAIADDETDIVTLGVNFHFNGQRDKTKLSVNYRIIDEEPTDIDNNELIVQWQAKI